MKNSLESLRAEAEKQQARAEGLAEQVAALRRQLNEAKALANFYGDGYTSRLKEIKHIKLVEAGKRGALTKQLNQLRAENRDLQLEVERVMNEKEIEAGEKMAEILKLEEQRDGLKKENDAIKWDYNQLQTVLTNTRRSYVRDIKEWDELTERIMRRNLWQRIINKPVTISGETETTEDHEQKPERKNLQVLQELAEISRN